MAVSCLVLVIVTSSAAFRCHTGMRMITRGTQSPVIGGSFMTHEGSHQSMEFFFSRVVLFISSRKNHLLLISSMRMAIRGTEISVIGGSIMAHEGSYQSQASSVPRGVVFTSLGNNRSLSVSLQHGPMRMASRGEGSDAFDKSFMAHEGLNQTLS